MAGLGRFGEMRDGALRFGSPIGMGSKSCCRRRSRGGSKAEMRKKRTSFEEKTGTGGFRSRGALWLAKSRNHDDDEVDLSAVGGRETADELGKPFSVTKTSHTCVRKNKPANRTGSKKKKKAP